MARSLTLSVDATWIIVASILAVASLAGVVYMFVVMAAVPAKSAVTSQYNLDAINELEKPNSTNVFYKTLSLAPPAISQGQITYQPQDLGKTNLSQLGQ